MRKLWMVFPALLLIAGMVMTGCPNDTTPKKGTPTPTDDITWTVTADGSSEADGKTGKENTTKLTITFSAAPKNLTGQTITIEGPVERGAMTGSGAVRDIAVTPTGSGSVSVKINVSGVEAGPKTARVWKAGEVATNGFTAKQIGGAAGTATTTKIELTFDEDVTGLTADDIEIVLLGQSGSASKGTVSATSNPKVWELGITVATEGNIQVKVIKEGFDSTPRTVAVYMDLTQGIVIPPDGDNGTMAWILLAIDPSDDDPEKQADNEEWGKGVITGDDFDLIVEATAYKGTFLRVYIDTSESNAQSGYGVGALGNRKDGGGVIQANLNLGFNWPPSGYVVDLPLKALKDYYDVVEGEIFVNVWSKVKVVGIQLWAPLDLELEDVLPDGYREITIPSMDGSNGKGWLGSADMAAINAAGPDAYLEIEGLHGSGGWGKLIYNNSFSNEYSISFLDGGSGNFVEQITIAEIRTLVSVPVGTTLQVIGFNLYNGGYFTKMYLVDPDAMDPNAPIPYTPLADGGAFKTSTKITFNFAREVTSLSDSDITITDGTGSVTKGTVSGSGKTWVLTITNVTAGTITVQIPSRSDINDGEKIVTVFYAAAIKVPTDGTDGTYTWTNLTIDTDATVSGQTGDAVTGQGDISGSDFDSIVDAKQWKDTFLRIYIDQSEAGAWPGGALGNKNGYEGSDNLGFSAPASGDYVDRSIKDLKKYFDDTDGHIYVNVWNGIKVVGILLFVPNSPEAESTLPDGVTEITLPNEGTPGKGTVGSFDVAAINNAAPGSFLELYVVGSTQSNVGWGIGTIGPTWTDTDCLPIPSQGIGDFKVIIQIDDLRAKYTGDIDVIIINLYGCDGLEKIYLVEPTGTELNLPSGDSIPGKGELGSSAVAAINAAAPGSFLKFHVQGSTEGNVGWGLGSIGPTWTTSDCLEIPSQGLGDFTVTILVADLLALPLYTNGVADTIAINLWACSAITKLELFEP